MSDTLSQSVLNFLIALMVALACAITLQVADVSLESGSNETVATKVDPMSTYRYTAEGWRDSTDWRLPKSESRIRAIDYFHPGIWTLLVVISVLIAMVISTGEEELSRMLGDDEGNGKSRSEVGSYFDKNSTSVVKTQFQNELSTPNTSGPYADLPL